MNHRAVQLERTPNARFPIARMLAYLILLVTLGAAVLAQNPGGATSGTGAADVRVKHVLGFEGISTNVNGSLSIQDDGLQFQKGNGPAARVSIGSIQDVFVGESDKQVGGVPMTVGKVAAPYGGGRVIGLFAHKKYDTLSLEYLDTNGGFHGAIFQLDKGQGQVLRDELVAKGAHVTQVEDQPAKQNTPEAENESK
jgi:hypothetical protein